ncbi:MAG TPA: glutathione transferase GstA [Telluria sp.]
MKLYFSPGACSLSPHIVLLEAGLEFSTEQVDLRTKLDGSGADYTRVNPKGSVPALKLKDGAVLTEGPAIVQFLADLVPEKQLAPLAGSFERYRLIEWLNYISTEVHKGFSPLFKSGASPDARDAAISALAVRFGHVARSLEGRDYLLGDRFTVADAYLFTVLNWTGFTGIDLAPWPALQAFQARVAARPAVQQALRAEGLVK